MLCDITRERCTIRSPEPACTCNSCNAWRESLGISLVYVVVLSYSTPLPTLRVLGIFSNAKDASNSCKATAWKHLVKTTEECSAYFYPIELMNKPLLSYRGIIKL